MSKTIKHYETSTNSVIQNSAPCTQTSLPTNSFKKGDQHLKTANPSIYLCYSQGMR